MFGRTTLFSKRKKLNSVLEILDEIFTKEQIVEYSQNARDVFHLLELLCEVTNISQEKTYRYIASILELPFVSQLHLPNQLVFREAKTAFDFGFTIYSDFDFSFFKKNKLFPQISLDNSLFLVAADPSLLERYLNSAELASLQVAEHSQIEKAWVLFDQIYGSSFSSIKEISLRTIQRLCTEAYAKGAEEIFIWEEFFCRYEYFVGAGWYSGEITSEAFKYIFENVPLRTTIFVSPLANTSPPQISILAKASKSSAKKMIILELLVSREAECD